MEGIPTMIVGVYGDSVEKFRSVERIPTMIVCVHNEHGEVSFHGMNSYYDCLCTWNLEFIYQRGHQDGR